MTSRRSTMLKLLITFNTEHHGYGPSEREERMKDTLLDTTSCAAVSWERRNHTPSPGHAKPLRWVIVAGALAGCMLTVQCSRRQRDPTGGGDVPTSEQGRAPEAGEGKGTVLEVKGPPSVEVKNGQAAVIRYPEGFLFVIPQKTSIWEGTYSVLASKSGQFAKDGKKVLEGAGRMSEFMEVKVWGHSFLFVGGSRTSVHVQLDLWEEHGSIALYDGTDPATLDVSKLAFASPSGAKVKEAISDFIKESVISERTPHN